jgi:hypothetical protein
LLYFPYKDPNLRSPGTMLRCYQTNHLTSSMSRRHWLKCTLSLYPGQRCFQFVPSYRISMLHPRINLSAVKSNPRYSQRPYHNHRLNPVRNTSLFSGYNLNWQAQELQNMDDSYHLPRATSHYLPSRYIRNQSSGNKESLPENM